jgi:Fe-S-cluster-containing dehydrogenase component
VPQRKQSKGICTYCSKEVGKGGATKHLATCPQRQAAIAKADDSKAARDIIYHLRVEDRYQKEFWLDLEMVAPKP